MNIPALPCFIGWRPLTPEEIISKDASLVCVNPDNMNSLTKLGRPGDGPHGWAGKKLSLIYGNAMNSDYWFYTQTQKEYTPKSKPLPLPSSLLSSTQKRETNMKPSSIVILVISIVLGSLAGFFLGWPGMFVAFFIGLCGGLIVSWNNCR